MEVLRPGGAGYDTARKPQIERFAQIRPAAIAKCRTTHDVVEALALAKREGNGLAVRSGGHCFAGRSSTTGVLIDTSVLDTIALNAEVVTVGSGAKVSAIYDALAPERTIAGGCGVTVGIAGLALGGGLGVLGRRYGLTCDQVTAAEVVLASGEVVDADDDLLWALRGSGGGQFGVVTNLTLKTVPAPPTKCFHITHPLDEAAALIDWWQRVSPDAPDETAASLVVRPDGVHLFGVGDIDAETTEAMPYREAKRWLNENGPPEQDPTADERSKSEFFHDLIPAGTIATLVEHFANGTGARELDFSPWGGAYNRTKPDATAFPHRDARFLLKHTGPADWVERAYAITHPHGTGGAYVNFPDPYLENAAAAYHGPNLERLREIKARYDPANVFRFPQSL
ncbi:MAG TPA: FAD-binding oxidoreductase [Solirubrobacteraceae bacterium]|nr:FAD-binding oxidoreductase [Solirubrobacteraceae bacterium]